MMSEIIDVPMSGQRSLATVTAEIRTLQDAARQTVITYIIEIGRRLVEAKSMVAHGEWGTYLKEELGFSQSTANYHMRCFEEYGADQISLTGAVLKHQAFGNLSYTQAVALLALPSDEERVAFVESHDMSKMSTRELQEELKKRQQATADGEDGFFDSGSASAQNDRTGDGPSREELAGRLDDALEEIRENGIAMQGLEQKAEAFRVQAEGAAKLRDQHKAAEEAALREKEQALQASAEAERKAKEAADKVAAMQKELDNARKAEAKALKDLHKAQSDKTVPADVMEKLKKEAEAAAEASYKADSEALDEAKKERARAEIELDKARREAKEAADKVAAMQKELALAAPELAVFRARFERVQADLMALIRSVDGLPEDKRGGAWKAMGALIETARSKCEGIGE